MSNIIEISDPRSPSVDFIRTPLRLVKKIIDEESISTETRVTNDSIVNASSGDLMTTPPTVNHSNDTDDSFHSAISENDIEPLIVNLDTKETKNNKKFRRALGCIKNRLTETPKTDMRRKLWRNMEDERIKKGVENTPPLPFKDLTASAPPKLYRNQKFS